MAKPNVALKKPRPHDPNYTLYRFSVGWQRPKPKMQQVPLAFHDWEEVREPRAFGPPGKRR